MGVAYKIKVAQLADANLKVTSLTDQVNALNATVGNLQGQITNLTSAAAIQNTAINELKADADAKQAQLNTLAQNLKDMSAKQAATLAALEAATAPQTDAAILTDLQQSVQGVLTWASTLNTSQ